jgi:hypothetical protein
VSIGIGNASDVVLIEANPREVIATAPMADAVGDVYATKTRAGEDRRGGISVSASSECAGQYNRGYVVAPPSTVAKAPS